MNALKLVTLLFVLSLGLVSCKNAKTADAEAISAENAVPSESAPATGDVLTANKQNAVANLVQMQDALNKEIENMKAQLESIDAGSKPALKVKIDDAQKHVTEIQALITKVNEATEATWAAVSTEVEGIHYRIKNGMKPGEFKPSAKQ